MQQQVLIVDDTPEIVDLLTSRLANEGYTIIGARSGAEALRVIGEGFDGPVILDLHLPDYKGLELFETVHQLNDTLPIVIITAHGTIALAIEAIRRGAFDFLQKTDAFLDRVHVATKNAFAHMLLHHQVRRLSNELGSRYNFDNIISVSEPMRKVFEQLTPAVGSRITVCIFGESGTGKELIARALHYNGSRRDAPFVPVNCAGIPETLLESELFGYDKGAFTGASARKKGKFEVANGGTLFLDEIGEMPKLLQSKLLRVLQEKEVVHLGGNERIPLDVRVVCATNVDLAEAVRRGDFREDLYYRLAVYPIHLPPLRDRLRDVPLLALHFAQRFAREEGKDVTGFEPEALAALLEHNYPGNVRELENLVSHAVVVSSGPRIRLQDLPPILRARESGRAPGEGKQRLEEALNQAIHDVDAIPPMESIEAMVIERAVELCDGNLVQAARRLGISRATIYRRIGKLGLKRA